MSGEPLLKVQCLPFGQIPHTSRLFADFLSWSPKVHPFYSRPPGFSEWFKDEAARVRYDPDRRERVATILERQNKSWGASAATLENIRRLRAGAFAAVTGQQVGLFGGPLFSLFKALSALKLAEQANAGGVDCVPVFWLATQDHDLDEVNQIAVPGAEAQLQKISAVTQGVTGAPVGDVRLGPEIEATIQQVAELLGESEVVGFLRESYRPDEGFGTAFARLFSRLLGEWGVILRDASDAELNAVAVPIYEAALERSAELNEKLLARSKELEAAGYDPQVKVTATSTVLFNVQNGVRTPAHRELASGDFIVGDSKFTKAELLQKLTSTPQEFSANVLLRPVVQDYLLPTLAYTGGAAETAYFAQVSVVYQALLDRVTPIVPRFSATIIESKIKVLLEKYRLQLTDILKGPEFVREHLAAQALPHELQTAFDDANASFTKSLTNIQRLLGQLDKTLIEAASNASSKISHQLESLRSRAARAELRQSETVARHADILNRVLYPEKALQERQVASIYFIARYGTQFLRDLHQAIHINCPDHQVVTL
jgi:bacillithiol biosynthesis cysteine-adding enzyme BshC